MNDKIINDALSAFAELLAENDWEQTEKSLRERGYSDNVINHIKALYEPCDYYIMNNSCQIVGPSFASLTKIKHWGKEGKFSGFIIKAVDRV